MPKLDDSKIKFVALSEEIDFQSFDCGNSDLNNFLINDALPHQEIGLAQVRLCYYGEELVGFFSLACDAIQLKSSEKRGEPRLRYRFLPAIKIGRLAIKKRCQKKGFGRRLVASIVGLAHKLNTEHNIGCRFISVDAYPESVGFYKKLGFELNRHKDYKKYSAYPSMRLDIYKYKPS